MPGIRRPSATCRGEACLLEGCLLRLFVQLFILCLESSLARIFRFADFTPPTTLPLCTLLFSSLRIALVVVVVVVLRARRLCFACVSQRLAVAFTAFCLRFAPTTMYTQPRFTPTTVYTKPRFTPNTKPPLTTVYTKPPFTPTTVYTSHPLRHTKIYTNHRLADLAEGQ